MRKPLFIFMLSMLSCACSKSGTKPAPVVAKPVTPADTALTVIVGAKPVVKTNPQKVFVHYMAWFEDKTTSGTGAWGQHWTMANENPDIIQANGRRQIASWFYPMIGPYASSDPDVIDYHLLLMKYAGIDGVIVDWYGIHQVLDYPLVKRNTDSLFNRIPYAGLQFAICYEDQTLGKVRSIASIDTVTAAAEDFAYLQSQYFKSSSYIRVNDQPLLLCFGPQGMKKAGDWQQAFSGLSSQPRFLSLEYQGNVAGTAGNGEFAWVNATNLADLQGFYQNRVPQLGTGFAGAYPGFKDFYKQGGWGNNLFIIDHNGTTTLQNTLDLAKNSKLPYLQLITWNDFGEGTMIEPTLDYNFDFLKTIQQYTGVSYTETELQLIYKWYTLRKKYKGNADIEQKLTDAYNSLVALDVAAANTIISGIK